jgi:hypothetical protein
MGPAEDYLYCSEMCAAADMKLYYFRTGRAFRSKPLRGALASDPWTLFEAID